MPVPTPEPAEQVPVAPMSEALVTAIIEAHAAGDSARKIAATRDLGLRRVQRLLKRPDVAARVKELRAENQKREKATARKREQREREREAAADPEAFAAKQGSVTSATRIARKGWNDLYVSEKTGIWMYEASVGWDRPATRADFTRRGVKPPPAFEDEYGFGQPGYDRPPIGFVPENQRPVRMIEVKQGPYGPFEVGHPVPAGEVPQREAEGWTRVA
jgi:hypothetical protein